MEAARILAQLTLDRPEDPPTPILALGQNVRDTNRTAPWLHSLNLHYCNFYRAFSYYRIII